MISITQGKPGTGKTYSAVVDLFKDLQNQIDVYVNWQVNPKEIFKDFDDKSKYGHLYFWDTIEEFCHIKKGVVYMDEAYIYINSRNWQKLPERMQWKLMQHRHDQIDIKGYLPSYKRLDPFAREIIHEIYDTKKIGRFIFKRQFDVNDIDNKTRQSIGIKIYFQQEKFFRAYNTTEKFFTDGDENFNFREIL